MSNLAQTQAEWTRLFREMGFYLSLIKLLDDIQRKFDSTRNRVQLVEQNSVNAFTSAWSLSGAVYGTNTDELGTLYVRIAKDAFATTVAVASNGVNVNTFVGAQTLNVASTTGFPAAGTLSVTTGSGVVIVTYTGGGGGGTTFTGCTASGAGVLATGGAVTASTVSLYRAAGGGGTDLMALATGGYPAAGTNTLTLLAQNSSGLTGTVALTTLTTSESDDKHRLLVFIDTVVRARSVFDGTKVEHGALLSGWLSAAAQCQTSIGQCRTAVQNALDGWFATRAANFLGSSQGQTINAQTLPTQGLIITKFAGFLEDLRADMVDEATAGAQKIVKNTVASTAPVADAHNVGQGPLSTPTLNEWAQTGTLTLVCIDPTVGSEQFQVTQRIAITNQVIAAENPLQVKRTFASPALGIASMLLSRTMVFTAGTSNDFGAIGSWTVNGESPTNTVAGVIYLRVVVNPSSGTQFLIEGWTTPTFASGTQVFSTDYGVANATVNINAIGGSGLSGLAVLGSAPTTLHTGTLNLQTFVAQGSVAPGVPDKFTCSITRSTSGEFQDRIGELYAYGVNSVTAGSQTINEGLATAGSIVPYTVRDA